ncbi:MAG TPA: LysR family transcriptional regulator [Terricaulis sp.]|nr:LysR family transcriptional regulator [Terricaulis sp.]HRP09742.1 LysR family transcriptional regulator [Terricaulis sp.]
MVATPYLKSFQALELAVRTGSLRAAADVLAITPAAVGQRIKALEEYLGVDLLVRGRSGLRPTPELAAAIPNLSAAFRELELVAAALDLQRGQEIHVAAASDFADLWLKPRIHAFKRAHPNVLFCINGEGEAPLRFGPVDCEIKFDARRDGADLLFRDYVLPISSPENTERISKLTRRERLEGFPLLHLDFYKDDSAALNWSAWIKRNKLKRTAPERGMRFQRITAALEAVRANAGLTLCGLALIAELIESKEFSLPFPLGSGAWTDGAFQARFRSEAMARPQVRRFREWLLEECGRTQAWLWRNAPSQPSA